MRKTTAVLAMAGIVTLLLGADYLVLTSTASLSRMARRELGKVFGESLNCRDVRLSMDGMLALKGVVFHTPGRRHQPLAMELAEVRFAGGRPGGRVEKVVLYNPRLSLSESVIEELRSVAPKGSIREQIAPGDLPGIFFEGGTFEAVFPAYFAVPGGQEMSIRGFAMTPIGGYRYYAEGLFESPVFGAWRAAGTFDLDDGTVRLTLRAAGLRVGPGLRGGLAPGLQGIWDKYGPGGLCDLSIEIAQEPGRPLEFRAGLLARDMSLLYANFPYKIEKVAGEIEFLPDRFRIKHMAGRHNGAAIRLDGAGGGYGEEADYAFRIEIDDMALADDLRAALDGEGRRTWDLFSPSGRVDARGRILRERGPGLPTHIPLDLAVRGAYFTYRDFPYEMRNASGGILLDGADVTIRNLAAQNGELSVSLAGSIRGITGDAAVDLTVDAKGLALDNRLRKALPEEVRRIWDDFSPSGRADVFGRVTQEKGKPAVHSGRVHPRGASVTWREVPLPVSDVDGEVEVGPGIVRLNHMKGKAHGAQVEAHGTLEGGVTSLRVGAVGLVLDDAVKGAFPARISDFLKALRLSGTADFTAGLSLKKGGKQQVDLALKLTRGVIDTAPKFEDIQGNVTLTGFFEDEPALMGFLNFSRVTVWGKRLADLSASFNVKGPRVNFVNVKATAYGGVISSPSFSLDTKTGVFGGSFAADRLDIREYSLDTAGYSKKTLAGKAALELIDLSGTAGDGATVTGRGRFTIRDGYLWDIPIFASLITFNPQDLFKSRNQFDAGDIHYSIKDRKFHIEKLVLTSKSVTVVGQGTIDFDGELDLILKAKTGSLLGIPLFGDLFGTIFGGIKDFLIAVHLNGSFENPRTHQEFLPDIRK